MRRYKYPSMTKQLSMYLPNFCSIVNIFCASSLQLKLSLLLFIPTEDFHLTIEGGEFTDSEIIVMLGENGKGNDSNSLILFRSNKTNQTETNP